MSSTRESPDAADHSFVVVASRLPVDRVDGADGGPEWRPSPGGLVTALEPVMREAGGAWIGWAGDAGPAPGAVAAGGMQVVGARPSRAPGRHFFQGLLNRPLWPLDPAVLRPPQVPRRRRAAPRALHRPG